MKHLGDITKINGAEVPTVDVIIGGSPCQDLSVAGKRAGLAGERSGLYMEQIRIIKEMRSNVRADGHLRGESPRYMVWENVPGAFSSNGGEDFRAVLEEAAHIVEPECVIPRPENGKWTNAGCIMGDGWSLAWRVHDAQFWGVPQRRRRIALVADFGGGSAPEILFEREGLRGDFAQGGTEGQGVAADAEGCAGAAISFVNRGHYCLEDISETIRSECHSDTPCVVYNEESVTSKTNASNPVIGDPCHTLSATGAGRTICIQGNCIDRADTAGCNGKGWRDDDVSFTLNTIDRPAVLYQPRSAMEGNWEESDVKNALRAGESKSSHAIVHRSAGFCPEQSEKTRGIGYEDERCPTLRSGAIPGVVQNIYDARGNGDQYLSQPMAVCISGDDVADTLDASYYKGCGERGFEERTVVATGTQSIVRHLTPLECERLQGYPDGWTDIGEWVDSKGKRHQTTDSARYKALGNSIALPYWRYLLKRISAQFEYTPTMASLFDGIGGFPYLWEGINGKGTCLWASEIEEFPMAVTKRRIGE